MKLFNNYILVAKPQEKKEGFQTVSGITKVLGEGEVVQVPAKCEVKVGDYVYFQKHLGTEFEIDGRQVKFVQLEDIMGIK